MKSLTIVVALAVGSFVQVRASQDETVYRPRDGVSLPKLVHVVHARYTADAMRRRVKGAVVLECTVTRDGLPTDIVVVQALDDDMDQEAMKALGQWRFTPGMKDGKAVLVRVEVKMAFTLK